MRKKRQSDKKLVAAALVVILAIAAVSGAALLFERGQQRSTEEALAAKRDEVQETFWTDQNTVLLDDLLYGFDHRIETFLFVGTDNSGDNYTTDLRGPMADFLLLMVIDHTDNTIGYIQIDRNTVTYVNELDVDGSVIYRRELQICTAHWYGRSPEMSAENTVEAVKNYLGGLEDIDGYFVINMSDIGTLNHTVGGVEITVEDDLDASDAELAKGSTLVLDDAQAERFLRARMGVGEGTNAERMVRQRQYMASFFNRVKEKTMENPRFGVELWDMLKGVAVSNMNGNDFSRIAQKLLKGTDKGIHTIKGETIEGTLLGDDTPHEEFYPDETSVRDEMIDMFSLICLEDEEDYGDEEEDVEASEDEEEEDEYDEDEEYDEDDLIYIEGDDDDETD